MVSQESKQVRATFVKATEPSTVPLDRLRREWEESALQSPLPSGATIETLSIEGINCERVICGNVDRTKVLLHFHGGGFGAGSCKTHRNLAALLSRAAGVPVLLIDYSLAPEHPFPAGIEDIVRVYRWLLAQGMKSQHIAFSGDSAGGNLAISSMLYLRDQGDALPAAAILMSAWLDLTLHGESIKSHAEVDPSISQWELIEAAKHYIGERTLDDPLISPIFADLHDLPPLLIQVGDLEILLSDSVRFAEKANVAGVTVDIEVWPEMWHVWHSWAPGVPEAQAAIDKIGGFVQKHLTVSTGINS